MVSELIEYAKLNDVFGLITRDFRDFEDFVDEALENYTKAEVKNKHNLLEELGEEGDKFGKCPVCNITVHEDNKFCSQCGQALSWEEE